MVSPERPQVSAATRAQEDQGQLSLLAAVSSDAAPSDLGTPGSKEGGGPGKGSATTPLQGGQDGLPAPATAAAAVAAASKPHDTDSNRGIEESNNNNNNNNNNSSSSSSNNNNNNNNSNPTTSPAAVLATAVAATSQSTQAVEPQHPSSVGTTSAIAAALDDVAEKAGGQGLQASEQQQQQQQQHGGMGVGAKENKAHQGVAIEAGSAEGADGDGGLARKRAHLQLGDATPPTSAVVTTATGTATGTAAPAGIDLPVPSSVLHGDALDA